MRGYLSTSILAANNAALAASSGPVLSALIELPLLLSAFESSIFFFLLEAINLMLSTGTSVFEEIMSANYTFSVDPAMIISRPRLTALLT